MEVCGSAEEKITQKNISLAALQHFDHNYQSKIRYMSQDVDNLVVVVTTSCKLL